ncbi:hypothetical protein WOLCODRAFT_161097 [Wolfiporia cocos MD-104 SS10]|uniref:Uncharacterized protein n=1 Tax=Wolfiporia cocos (strain MD-104) TaxID=742152 RepID=A0A2H3J6G3_WOLCO|nr:hypothetical protein WOLCODRAFT_161097 [Wolfiporia cocos MD-104 SS10]
MPSLRRTLSSPARRAPYSAPPSLSPAASSTVARAGHPAPRRAPGTDVAHRRVLADIDWWLVHDGQCDPAPHADPDPDSDDENDASVPARAASPAPAPAPAPAPVAIASALPVEDDDAPVLPLPAWLPARDVLSFDDVSPDYSVPSPELDALALTPSPLVPRLAALTLSPCTPALEPAHDLFSPDFDAPPSPFSDASSPSSSDASFSFASTPDDEYAPFGLPLGLGLDGGFSGLQLTLGCEKDTDAALASSFSAISFADADAEREWDLEHDLDAGFADTLTLGAAADCGAESFAFDFGFGAALGASRPRAATCSAVEKRRSATPPFFSTTRADVDELFF